MDPVNDTGEIAPHPLFVDDEEHAPLKQRIQTIDVSKRAPSGKYVFVAWHDADELPDEMAVLEKYGPGSYKFDGKDKERSRILRKAFKDLGILEAAAPAPVPAEPRSSGGEMGGFLEWMKLENARREEERKQDREDRREERQREAERSREIVTIVTEFAKASLASGGKGAAAAVPAANPLAMLKEANEVLSEIRLGAEAEREVVREELRAAQEASAANDGGVMETFIASFGAGVAKKMGVEMVDPAPKGPPH